MPCCVNQDSAKLFDEFLITIVSGDDMISRTNFNSLDMLQEEIKRLLADCNLPKYKIFGSAFSSYFRYKRESKDRKKNQGQDSNIEDGYVKDIDLDCYSGDIKNRKWMKGYIHYLAAEYKPIHNSGFLPGKILYLEKKRQKGTIKQSFNLKRKVEKVKDTSLNLFMNTLQETLKIRPYSSFDYKYIYTPRWASKEEFQEIIISRSMVTDHLDVFGIFDKFANYDEDTPLHVYS